MTSQYRCGNAQVQRQGQLASRFHLEACYDCATRASRAGTAASSRCLAAADDSEGVFLTSGRAFPSVFSRSPEINACYDSELSFRTLASWSPSTHASSNPNSDGGSPEGSSVPFTFFKVL